MRLKSVSEASLGVLEGSWGYFGGILGHFLELKNDLESIFEAIYRNIVNRGVEAQVKLIALHSPLQFLKNGMRWC